MDSSLNISENINGGQIVLSFQLVGFIAWDSTSYNRKEMQTTFPDLLTISESASLFDLRVLVSERVGVPFHNVNIAAASSFPIQEGSINPIKELTKQGLSYVDEKEVDNKRAHKLVIPFQKKQKVDNDEVMKEGAEDPDEVAQKQAEQENRDGKTWNFKNEKKVILKKIRVRNLEIICWEDLRKKVDKPASNQSSRSKWSNRDGEDLKIKN